MTVKFVLDKTLENKGKSLTRNAIAVKASVRPATLHDMVRHQAKSISLETLDKILIAMNELDPNNNYDIGDIIEWTDVNED